MNRYAHAHSEHLNLSHPVGLNRSNVTNRTRGESTIAATFSSYDANQSFHESDRRRPHEHYFAHNSSMYIPPIPLGRNPALLSPERPGLRQGNFGSAAYRSPYGATFVPHTAFETSYSSLQDREIYAPQSATHNSNSRPKLSDTRVDKKDKLSDEESAKAASELLLKLGIHESTFDLWGENMRKFLSTYILQQLVKAFEESNAEFTTIENSPEVIKKCASLASEDEAVRIRFILLSFPTEQVCVRRRNLENYLKVPVSKGEDRSNIPSLVVQAYVLARLNTLARTELRELKWEQGSVWNGDRTACLLPTDSQILVHVFATYIRQYCPQYNLDRHFRDASISSRRIPVEQFCLAQTRGNANPPYFMVEVYGDSGDTAPAKLREEWRCYPGSTNVYSAMVLFLYFIKTSKQFRGRIGQCDMNKDSKDKSQIFPINQLIPYVLQE
jgi:hypothetical protein